MTDWFRSWHGAPTDNKWLLIARRANVPAGIVSAIWWALLDHASQALDRGKVRDFDVETYSIFSGFSEDQIRAVLAALTDKGLILNGVLISWEKRQPTKEDVTAVRRKRTQRERDKEKSARASRRVTPRHAASRDVTAEQNREEKNRTEKKESNATLRAAEIVLPDWLPPEPWASFLEMRRKMRAPMTPRAEKLAITELEKLRASGQDPGAVLEQSVMRSWRGLFPIGEHGNGRKQQKSNSEIAAEFIADLERGDGSADRCENYGFDDNPRQGERENRGGVSRAPPHILPRLVGKN